MTKSPSLTKDFFDATGYLGRNVDLHRVDAAVTGSDACGQVVICELLPAVIAAAGYYDGQKNRGPAFTVLVTPLLLRLSTKHRAVGRALQPCSRDRLCSRSSNNPEGERPIHPNASFHNVP